MHIEVATIAATCSATIRETTELRRINSFSLRDQIPDPAQRMDLNGGVDFGKAFAQPVDIDLHGVRTDFLRQTVKIAFEQILADHTTAAAQQMLEYGDLARREENRLL